MIKNHKWKREPLTSSNSYGVIFARRDILEHENVEKLVLRTMKYFYEEVLPEEIGITVGEVLYEHLDEVVNHIEDAERIIEYMGGENYLEEHLDILLEKSAGEIVENQNPTAIVNRIFVSEARDYLCDLGVYEDDMLEDVEHLVFQIN